MNLRVLAWWGAGGHCRQSPASGVSLLRCLRQESEPSGLTPRHPRLSLHGPCHSLLAVKNAHKGKPRHEPLPACCSLQFSILVLPPARLGCGVRWRRPPGAGGRGRWLPGREREAIPLNTDYSSPRCSPALHRELVKVYINNE